MTSRDTDADARAAQIGALRRIGGAGRVEQAFRMSEQARRISIAGILRSNPNLSQAEARAILLRRVLGEDLYQAAYGDGAV
jgi:hypothetical protein